MKPQLVLAERLWGPAGLGQGEPPAAGEGNGSTQGAGSEPKTGPA